MSPSPKLRKYKYKPLTKITTASDFSSEFIPPKHQVKMASNYNQTTTTAGTTAPGSGVPTSGATAGAPSAHPNTGERAAQGIKGVFAQGHVSLHTSPCLWSRYKADQAFRASASRFGGTSTRRLTPSPGIILRRQRMRKWLGAVSGNLPTRSLRRRAPRIRHCDLYASQLTVRGPLSALFQKQKISQRAKPRASR